jgi:hypothetical protein
MWRSERRSSKHLCTLGIDLRGEKKNTFRMLALFEHNRGKYFKMISSGKKKSFFPFISLGEKKLVLVIYEFHGDHCYLLKPQ